MININDTCTEKMTLSIEEQHAAAKDRLAQLPTHKAQLQKDIKRLEALLRKEKEDEAYKAHKEQQLQIHKALRCYYNHALLNMVGLFSNTPEREVWEEFIQARIKALAAALD